MSFHGTSESKEDFRVWTEYGADAWTQAISAGFAEVRIRAVDFPDAIAITAIKQA